MAVPKGFDYHNSYRLKSQAEIDKKILQKHKYKVRIVPYVRNKGTKARTNFDMYVK